MKNQVNNPLICDTATGICEMPVAGIPAQETRVDPATKPLKVIYFTDPICSSCWGIEPQLRKLKLEYGNNIEIEYRMGGLLPDWSYNSGGISKPSDVASHWDEVSAHYDMPIDGDVWLEDPLASSYPPSIAFKAAQMQDAQKAIDFLRSVRELLFLQKKNICRWEHIATAARRAGLKEQQLRKDYEGSARELFSADLELAKQLGVRGFPTLFFWDRQGRQEIVYGSRPYVIYEETIGKLLPAVKKAGYATDWKSLFEKYPSLTSREFAELSGTPRAQADAALEQLRAADQLKKLDTKNGPLWIRKSGLSEIAE